VKKNFYDLPFNHNTSTIYRRTDDNSITRTISSTVTMKKFRILKVKTINNAMTQKTQKLLGSRI